MATALSEVCEEFETARSMLCEVFRVLLPENMWSTPNGVRKSMCASLFTSIRANYSATFFGYVLCECFGYDFPIFTYTLCMFSLGFRHGKGDWARLSLRWKPEIQLGFSKHGSFMPETFQSTSFSIMFWGWNLFEASKSVEKSIQSDRTKQISWNSAVFRLHEHDRIDWGTFYQSLKYVQPLVPINFKCPGRFFVKIRLEFYWQMTTAFTFIFTDLVSLFWLIARIYRFYFFCPLAFSDDACLLPVWACNLETRSVLFWIPAPAKTAKQAGLNSFPGKYSMITTLDQQ